jgi:hypothetical protein
MEQAMMNPGVAVFFFLAIGSIALFSFLAVAAWSGARSAEREAYYKNDMLKKLAESSEAGAAATLEYLREQEKIAERKRSGGLQLGGLITAAAGIGIMIFFLGVAKNPHVYLMGTIPLLIGIALTVYGYVLAPKE